MKKISILLLFALSPTFSFGQPPEEIPPPPPETDEFTEVTPVTPEPAPAPVASEPVAAPPPEPAPVAEPEVVIPPTPPEEKALKGVEISPNIGVYPIGYDSVNIGEDHPEEGGRYFFLLKPGIGLSTSFKTSAGRIIDFSTAYDLYYREYFNKKTTDRDFEHDVEASVRIPWTPRLSNNLSALFVYFFKSGADTVGDNALYLESETNLTFKVNDPFSMKIGFWFYFLDVFDDIVGPGGINNMTNPPGDIDDLRGGIDSEATGLGNFGESGFFDVGPGAPLITQPVDEESAYMAGVAATVGATYVPIKGTTLGFNYRYVAIGYSNLDAAQWTGHYITPSVTQALPWEGGVVVLKNELRLQSFDYAENFDKTGGKFSYRDRLTLALEQKINSYLTWTGWYRLQLKGSNAHPDGFGFVQDNHWLFTGVVFNF